ncbi:MAG: ATP-binding protein [Bryobacteraceae bacterium]
MPDTEGIATGARAPIWRTWIRPQDIVWLLLFLALGRFSPVQGSLEIVLLLTLALFQVVATKLAVFSTPRGSLLVIATELAIAYPLMHYTGDVASSYYVVLLLPIVFAGTTMGLLGVASVTVLACAEYISLLLFLDWKTSYIPSDQIAELVLRVALLPVVGLLTHELAEKSRRAVLQHQAVAKELATANANLREAEAAVRRSERLAALGQLTAGLAHELRNPLGTIKNSAEMLSRTVPPGSEIAQEMAGYIATEVDRANSLVTRFLDFARPLRLELTSQDLNAVLERAISDFSRRKPPFDVEVYRNYSPDVPKLAIDAEMLGSVILNLLTNAAQASPPKAVVTLKTRLLANGVEISVIDRGSGIQPDHLENIFNPFFTTKPEGVGLGLAIVSKIVDEHGGTIAVESEVGQGSVFRIILPLKRP